MLLIVLVCLIARFGFRWFVASRMLPAIPLVASRMLPVIPLVASRMHGQGGFSLSVRSLSRSSCRVSTVLSIALALPSLCSLTLPESRPQFQHLAVLLLFNYSATFTDAPDEYKLESLDSLAALLSSILRAFTPSSQWTLDS